MVLDNLALTVCSVNTPVSHIIATYFITEGHRHTGGTEFNFRMLGEGNIA